jgi:hypothetical protein
MVIYARDSEADTHVVIVVTPNVMGQFMAQHSPDVPVIPEPVVHVGTDPELDDFALVDVQAQQPRVLVRSEFRQQSNREPVQIHHMKNRFVVRQLREYRPGRVGIWEMF